MDQAMYFVALESVTRYALSESIKAVMQNKLGHTFFPSPVELRRLCDEAQRPHDEYARKLRSMETQLAERAAYERTRTGVTPEGRARCRALYAAYCADHEEQKNGSDVFVPKLDPELVALVPDAPTTFKQAKVA